MGLHSDKPQDAYSNAVSTAAAFDCVEGRLGQFFEAFE